MHIENKVQRFILHYAFLPRINPAIKSFIKRWNSHPLRRERNWSSGQLCSYGMIDLRNSHITLVGDVQENINIKALEDLEWFSMDWYATTPSDDELSTINSMGCQCTFQWQCILESDSKCKSIMIFAVTCNRYFYRRYKSHFKLVGVICPLSTNMHVFDIKFSFISNKKIRI